MACYHPLPGWFGRERSTSGKRPVVFRLSEGYKDRPVFVPCGRCIGCQLERSRQWAVRCMHEAGLHDASCFVTLTYSEDKLPYRGSLEPKHFVDFMKRLRSRLGEVRYFQCGEYGEQLSRPHHHALLFGLRFPDEVRRGKTSTSALLEELWGHGYCVIGDVTFESAAYVARYALKKVVGAHALSHYGGRLPEYCTMSRRPGIGASFVDKYGPEVYRDDSVIVRGTECKPPRYYDERFARKRPRAMARVKESRLEALRHWDEDLDIVDQVKVSRKAAANGSPDNTGRRLLVREQVKLASIRSLARHLEVA